MARGPRPTSNGRSARFLKSARGFKLASSGETPLAAGGTPRGLSTHGDGDRRSAGGLAPVGRQCGGRRPADPEGVRPGGGRADGRGPRADRARAQGRGRRHRRWARRSGNTARSSASRPEADPPRRLGPRPQPQGRAFSIATSPTPPRSPLLRPAFEGRTFRGYLRGDGRVGHEELRRGHQRGELLGQHVEGRRRSVPR